MSSGFPLSSTTLHNVRSDPGAVFSESSMASVISSWFRYDDLSSWRMGKMLWRRR
jgi:hypothetical protein